MVSGASRLVTIRTGSCTRIKRLLTTRAGTAYWGHQVNKGQGRDDALGQAINANGYKLVYNKEAEVGPTDGQQ